MASAGPPPNPSRQLLTKEQSITVPAYSPESDNPFHGKGENGKIYHLKPHEVGLGRVCTDRTYDSATQEKIFEFRTMYGTLPIFGKPCDIKLLDTIFEIVAMSGYGAFGQVYRVQVKGKPEKQFALKVLLARSGRRYTPDREFKVIQSLKTNMFASVPRAAHIIPFLAVAEHAEVKGIRRSGTVQCGLVLMDFASNGELFDAIVKVDAGGEKTPNAFDARFTRRLIRQAIFGLERLLKSGYTHRDLKPDNMLFDAHCNLVLCDLGHVKNLREGKSEEGKPESYKVQTAMDRGTPRYTAPELQDAAKGGFKQMKYDSMKSDIWAIGITMFQLRSCICPMDVQDQLVKATFNDLDIAPLPRGVGKRQPDEFDVDAANANRRMWKKWDQFHKNISPGGGWHSTAWCRDYINEQFSREERAFMNLLLQKDPRCRVKLSLLAQAARGDMTDAPKGLAWLAKNDVPSDDEFKREMAKRIPGFGGKQAVVKRVSCRKLTGLELKGVPVSTSLEATQVIVSKLLEASKFSRPASSPPTTVEYFVSDKVAARDDASADDVGIVSFEDVRKRLRVICKVELASADGKVQCFFSRARGDAVMHLNFMHVFDAAFGAAAVGNAAAASSARAGTGLGKVLSLIQENPKKKASSTIAVGSDSEDGSSEEESDEEECVQA